jgi:hypothetical protein
MLLGINIYCDNGYVSVTLFMLLGINIYCDNGYVFVTLFMLLGISIALTLLCLSYARVWIPMFD